MSLFPEDEKLCHRIEAAFINQSHATDTTLGAFVMQLQDLWTPQVLINLTRQWLKEDGDGAPDGRALRAAVNELIESKQFVFDGYDCYLTLRSPSSVINLGDALEWKPVLAAVPGGLTDRIAVLMALAEKSLGFKVWSARSLGRYLSFLVPPCSLRMLLPALRELVEQKRLILNNRGDYSLRVDDLRNNTAVAVASGEPAPERPAPWTPWQLGVLRRQWLGSFTISQFHLMLFHALACAHVERGEGVTLKQISGIWPALPEAEYMRELHKVGKLHVSAGEHYYSAPAPGTLPLEVWYHLCRQGRREQTPQHYMRQCFELTGPNPYRELAGADRTSDYADLYYLNGYCPLFFAYDRNELLTELHALIDLCADGFIAHKSSSTPTTKEVRMSEHTEISAQTTAITTAITLVNEPSTALEPAKLKEISKRWLDGADFDLTRIRVECQALTANVMTSMIELGKRLCAVNEALNTAQFSAWMETESGLPFGQREAYKYMGVARATLERPELRKLTLTDTTKAAALLSLPDEQLDELAKSGTVNGTTLDEFQTMTRKELMAHVRSLKRQATEQKDNLKTQAEQLGQVRQQLADAERKVGQVLLNPVAAKKAVDDAVARNLEDFQKVLGNQLRTFDNLDVSQLNPELQIQLVKWLEWLGYRVERSRILVAEKLSEAGFSELADGGMAYEQNEQRRARFEDQWSIDAGLGGDPIKQK